MVIIKDLNLHNNFIYCTVTVLYMLQCVSFVCNVQFDAGVELLWYINISFFVFVLRLKCYAGRFKWSKEFCENIRFSNDWTSCLCRL